MKLPNANNFLFYDTRAGMQAHIARRLKKLIGKPMITSVMCRETVLAVVEFSYRYEMARQHFVRRMKNIAEHTLARISDGP